MAQHDFVINNQGFPSFRSDLNDFLNAVRTTHSGTSLPSGAVAGTIWLDTTSATIPLLKYYDGTDNILLATINHSTNTVTFSGVATDLVNDLTPQLGGMLDVNGQSIGDGTLELIKFSETASAVNEITITNSATGNKPKISASGDDTNIGLILSPKGTGILEVTGSTNSGRIQLNCEQNTHGIKLASPPHSASQSYTLTFPSTAPVAGKVLQTDGSGNLSFETPSSGLEWQSSIVTASTLTALVNKGYWINTTSNACTITLPASANVGDTIEFVDFARNWATNAITINQNSLNFQGSSSVNPIYNTNGQSVRIVYSGSTKGWIPTSDDDVTDETPPPNDIEYLVVAGGGGGGGCYGGGGGGAGGYRTGTYSAVATAVAITVTVGSGGASAPNSPSTGGIGSAGSTSEISGSGLSTITSAGGGYGSGWQSPSTAKTGGSGGSGGGGSVSSGAGGAGNTPSVSPSQGNTGGTGSTDVNSGGGGGGGAGAVGSNGLESGTIRGGAGGIGVANSITGSSIYYAGGGGGAGHNNSNGGAGGNGGGGAGGSGPYSPATVSAGVNGTANTGGGGGGAAYDVPSTSTASGSGGSGVVILKVRTIYYSGTTTGSPTVTTDGDFKIIKFTGSGSYTT